MFKRKCNIKKCTFYKTDNSISQGKVNSLWIDLPPLIPICFSEFEFHQYLLSSLYNPYTKNCQTLYHRHNHNTHIFLAKQYGRWSRKRCLGIEYIGFNYTYYSHNILLQLYKVFYARLCLKLFLLVILIHGKWSDYQGLYNIQTKVKGKKTFYSIYLHLFYLLFPVDQVVGYRIKKNLLLDYLLTYSVANEKTYANAIE